MVTKRKYPWIGMQDWRNIVFLHWQVDPEVLKPHVPASFQLDLFAEKAWISVVFFEASGTRARMMPKFIRLPTYYQLNVRTYVSYKDNEEAGIYFFNIYTESLLSMIGAKTIFHLPFQHVNFSRSSERFIQVSDKEQILFSAHVERETHRQLKKTGLSTFLTERYCIWDIKGNNIIKMPILHTQWELERVNVMIENEQLFSFLQGKFQQQMPMTHFSPSKHTVMFPYEIKGKI